MNNQTKVERTRERYQLMKQVFYYLTSKKMGFCFLENGQLISLKECEDYIADNHLTEYEQEV